MTDLVRGTVLGVDRDTGTVRADIAGVVVPAAPYLGDPPWPLSACWFFNAPAYTCLGPIGDKRVAFADDFNFYTAGTPLIGNTGWTAGGTAGSLSTPANPTDANGVLRLAVNVNPSSYFIRKTLQLVTLTETRCYWVSARVRQSVATAASGGMSVGLADTTVMAASGGGAASAGAYFDIYSSQSVVQSAASGSLGPATSAEAVAADTWCWADLLVAGGQWVAGWINGSGPWVSTSAVPSTANDSVTPFVRGTCVSGTTNNVDVDYFSLAQVDLGTTADPTTFGNYEDIVPDV